MTVKPVMDVTVQTITFLFLIAVGSDLRFAELRRLRAPFGLILAAVIALVLAGEWLKRKFG